MAITKLGNALIANGENNNNGYLNTALKVGLIGLTGFGGYKLYRHFKPKAAGIRSGVTQPTAQNTGIMGKINEYARNVRETVARNSDKIQKSLDFYDENKSILNDLINYAGG